MFGHRYFGAAYFGPRYWGQGGSITPTVEQFNSGGWKNVREILNREITKDQIRRQREELGIVPRQAKKIDKVADKLIDKIDAVEPNEILVQITATQEYDTLLKSLAKESETRQAAIAEFVAAQMFRRILYLQEQEERAIIGLLMEF